MNVCRRTFDTANLAASALDSAEHRSDLIEFHRDLGIVNLMMDDK